MGILEDWELGYDYCALMCVVGQNIGFAAREYGVFFRDQLAEKAIQDIQVYQEGQ